MTDIDEVKKQIEGYQIVRKEFYDFLDVNIPKNEYNIFDFSAETLLNAKEIYDKFYKLDYQARKLRALLMEARGISPYEK